MVSLAQGLMLVLRILSLGLQDCSLHVRCVPPSLFYIYFFGYVIYLMNFLYIIIMFFIFGMIILQFGYIVLTTSAGIMDHEEARRKNVGGKVLGFFY